MVFAGPLRISDLARAEQVKTPTITPIVAALERDSLVVREKDENDGRACRPARNGKGEKLMAEGRARRVARLTAALRELTPVRAPDASRRRRPHAPAGEKNSMRGAYPVVQPFRAMALYSDPFWTPLTMTTRTPLAPLQPADFTAAFPGSKKVY